MALASLAGLCLEIGQPGELDSSCPMTSFGDPGCCTEENLCGGMNTSFGLGCTYPSDEARDPSTGQACGI